MALSVPTQRPAQAATLQARQAGSGVSQEAVCSVQGMVPQATGQAPLLTSSILRARTPWQPCHHSNVN